MTKYRPKITILASRALTCINAVAKSSNDLEKTCSDLIKRSNCSFFHKKEKLLEYMAVNIFDIEELKKQGRSCNACPFYASRLAQETSELIFCPYNYIVDENIRRAMDINLKDAVVIIDEAHNIEDFCRSAGTVEVNSHLIDAVGIEILKKLRSGFVEEGLKKELYHILETLRKLKKIGENRNKSGSKENHENFKRSKKTTLSLENVEHDKIFNGADVVDIFISVGISKEDVLMFKVGVHSMSNNELTREMLTLAIQQILRSLCFVLEIIFFKNPDFYAFSMKKRNADFTLCFWLLDPSLIFLPLANLVKSIVLLSGTLSPFKTFASELSYKFAYMIEAPHIIDKNNIFISSIETGHLNKELLGTYNNTENLVYLDQIINIITKIRDNVAKKGGTLVFVPSYSFLDNLSKRMTKVRNIHYEPRTSLLFTTSFKSFKDDILGNKGPILVCVYRGRASEGMDFKDSYCRAVIAIGLPYPALNSQVKAKREYNDKHKELKGAAWYEAQAFRAVNQAVGRVIRHKDDWGGVFLVDKRYGAKRVQDSLSKWVKENIVEYKNSGKCIEMWNKFLMDK